MSRRHLRVDPIACAGIGICAHVAASLIAVDSWGFPIVPTYPLDDEAARKARLAVASCPRAALSVVEE